MDAESNVAKTDDKVARPNCVSTKHWERFEALKKRTDDITKRSTEKRIKHLKKNILQNVEDHLKTDEEKDILKTHMVKVSDRGEKHEPSASSSSEKTASCPNEQSNYRSQYSEIERYLGVNDHLKEGVGITGGPNSGLERGIEEAIQQGNIASAERLSDQLASRNYGVKIADAISARDYMKRKKEEEASAQAKKKKKLPWGFEHKQRWETKSNM